jgi:hypothetical protein
MGGVHRSRRPLRGAVALCLSRTDSGLPARAGLFHPRSSRAADRVPATREVLCDRGDRRVQWLAAGAGAGGRSGDRRCLPCAHDRRREASLQRGGRTTWLLRALSAPAACIPRAGAESVLSRVLGPVPVQGHRACLLQLLDRLPDVPNRPPGAEGLRRSSAELHPKSFERCWCRSGREGESRGVVSFRCRSDTGRRAQFIVLGRLRAVLGSVHALAHRGDRVPGWDRLTERPPPGLGHLREYRDGRTALVGPRVGLRLSSPGDG